MAVDVLTARSLEASPQFSYGWGRAGWGTGKWGLGVRPALVETHVLLADNLQSGSQLSTPVIGQENALLADNLQSGSQLSTPVIGQGYTLLADSLQSGSQLSTPLATGTSILDNVGYSIVPQVGFAVTTTPISYLLQPDNFNVIVAYAVGYGVE